MHDVGQKKKVLKACSLDPFISLLGQKNTEILSAVLRILAIMTDRNQDVVSLIVNNAIYMEKIICLMNFHSDFNDDCLVLNNYFLNLSLFRSKDELGA